MDTLILWIFCLYKLWSNRYKLAIVSTSREVVKSSKTIFFSTAKEIYEKIQQGVFDVTNEVCLNLLIVVTVVTVVTLVTVVTVVTVVTMVSQALSSSTLIVNSVTNWTNF